MRDQHLISPTNISFEMKIAEIIHIIRIRLTD
jgi:hypothetical protein